MVTMTALVEIHGTRPRVEFAIPTYACAWKQRPSVPALGIVTSGNRPTDNSTGVSALQSRHR